MTTHADTSKHPPTAWQQLKARSLSVETIRQVDRTAVERFHMHSLVLMENAAIGCAQWLIEHFERSPGGQPGGGYANSLAGAERGGLIDWWWCGTEYFEGQSRRD